MLTLLSSSGLFINPEFKKPSCRTISSRPLIVYAADWVPAASLQTRPESAIHLLLHLSVAPLHRTQIPVAGVVALDLRATNVYKYRKISSPGEVTASLSAIYSG